MLIAILYCITRKSTNWNTNLNVDYIYYDQALAYTSVDFFRIRGRGRLPHLPFICYWKTNYGLPLLFLLIFFWRRLPRRNLSIINVVTTTISVSFSRLPTITPYESTFILSNFVFWRRGTYKEQLNDRRNGDRKAFLREWGTDGTSRTLQKGWWSFKWGLHRV